MSFKGYQPALVFLDKKFFPASLHKEGPYSFKKYAIKLKMAKRYDFFADGR